VGITVSLITEKLPEKPQNSGAESSRLDQANLIAASGELPALVTLYNDTASGFDPDHSGANPAKGCGLEHLDHISGLKIQLHVREGENCRANKEGTGQSVVDGFKIGLPILNDQFGRLRLFRTLGTSNAPWRT